MSVEYTKKTWYDGSEGGTPITAAELNRVETGIDDVVTQSNADKTNIDNHTASKVNSSDGAHGLRYYNSELDYYDDTNEEWVEIQTGGGGTDVIVPNPQYGSTATKDYSVGDYIYSVRGTLGTDILYVVTAPITRSDTLVVDTNIALSTDEGAEVFVANIVSGEFGVPPYNIVGLVNSDGTVTRYGSSKDTSDIANRTLTNIQNTTTTDVECRYKDTGKTFIANDWNFVNGKYINIKSENNVIYAVVSEDGYTVTNKVATNLPSDVGYVFQNPNSNVYFAICVISGAKVSIFYSSDLATWTKVILPNSEGTEPEQGIYRYKLNYVSKPISYTLWGNTCIVIALGYRQYEDGEGIMQTDYTSIITARNGNDFAVANSNLGSFNENLDTSVFYQYYESSYKFVLSSYTSTDGLTYTKYTLPDDRSPQYVTKVEENYFIWGTDYTNHTCAVFSTTDFTTFTKVYDFYPTTWQEHPEFSDYFDEVNRVLFKNDTYFVLGSNYDSEHDTFKAAIVAIPSTFTNREWCDLPNGEYNFNPNRSKATVYDYRNGTEYNLLNISPFTAEVGKALTILDVGSGGSGGASSADEVSYDNTDSGLTADNVQDAIDEVLTKETTVTTDSYGYVITDPKNTHVTIPPASLSGTASMAVKSGTQGKQYTMTDAEHRVSADFYTKSAVDELVSGGGGTGNYPDLTNKPSINGVELLGNKLVGLLSTDIHINADKIGYSGTVSGASTTKAAIDALQSSLSGLHGIPSGGNTNQVLAKNSSSDYDLKWVNQTGGGGVGTVINLTTLYSALFNQTVTLTGTYDTYTATFDSTGHATVNVFYVDTYAVTCQDSTDSVTVTAIGLVINADVFSVAVVNLTTPYSTLFGQTVTLTGTNATYTSSFDASGHASVTVLYTDTYTVTCQSLTDSVTVSTLGTVVNATVFEITTVNITTSDSDLIGETISVYYGSDPTDVRASLTFDSNLSVSFQTEDIGTYNIVIGYSNPVSFTVSSIGDIVSVTYNPTPTGSSVTPVNNVRNWLDSAKVFDKNYTTISQVLSDTTTLQTLISSNNANDYLVRSTSWVSDVCGNSTAMSYIGLNNYSANTLLANSTWLNGICNSTYFESVLNVKVPTMTSNTTPSGTCFGSSIYDNNTSAYDYYLSFNGVKTIHTGWASLPTDNTPHIGYQYATGNNSNLIMAVVDYNTGALDSGITGYIQCNNNGSWQNLNSFTISTPNQGVTTIKVVIDNHNKYNSYRILFDKPTITGNGNTRYCRIVEIQFYGREDV